jgi:Family of unknown function (DUF6281)
MTRPLERWLGLLVAAFLAAPWIVACNETSSCFAPFETATARVTVGSLGGPPAKGSFAPATGACPIRVEYDGRLFDDTRAVGMVYDGWSLTDADLSPIGHATRGPSNTGFPFRDDSVYAIRDVDPQGAIAMQGPTAIIVLVADRNRWPDEVCMYLVKAPSPASVCPTVSPGPSGSGRTGTRTGP